MNNQFSKIFRKIGIQYLLIAILSIVLFIYGYMPAYQIYNSQGEQVDFKTLVNSAKKADIVFFGEQHTNPIDHWLELRLLKALYKNSKDKLVVGAEMFESDGQLLIDEYFAGHISKKSFEKEERLWGNYKTDYKPLLEFAKKKKLRFVATDIPRRYAASVAKKGLTILDSLQSSSLKYITDIPFKIDSSLEVYKELAGMSSGMAMMNGKGTKKMHGNAKKDVQVKVDSTKLKEQKEEAAQMKEMMKKHGMGHMVEAQAIKDATMAKFILKNFKDGDQFLHFDGSKHSDYHQGIVWYIKQKRPDLKILVISSTEQSSVDSLENENKTLGDFIIITPDDLTQTYR